MSAATDGRPNPLADPRFARWFVVWIPIASLATALVVVARPSWWRVVIAADLWALSYPHVASTFSRTLFRREDREEHAWMWWALAPLSIATCAGVVRVFGVETLMAGYFYWQTLHYARQGRGMYRALRHATGQNPRDPLVDVVLYAAALWGVAHRMAQRPTHFLGVAIRLPTAPPALEWVLCAVALVAFGAWVWRISREATDTTRPFDPWTRLYVIGQVILFVVGYVVIDVPSIGWIAVNVWHNAQYLLFVYAWNERRFANADAATLGALGRVAGAANSARFYIAFALIGAAMYSVAWLASEAMRPSLDRAIVYLVVLQAINLHHYVADMVLWTARRPARASAT
ncbi:MAG: hypothetical protein JNK05_19220 [Myxococcales bacterium]|nr:hypothetical protein [Myxococcales bacterium]